MSELKYKILKEEFDISQGLLKDLTKIVDELMKENKQLKEVAMVLNTTISRFNKALEDAQDIDELRD